MGGSKKKKKKDTMTPAQQEAAKLEKAVTSLVNSIDRFRVYVDRLDRWLLENHEKLIRMFQMFDTENTGKVTHGQFKAGLLDMKIPCSCVELHTLCKLIDREGQQMIEYNRVARGLAFVRDREERHRAEDVRPVLRVQYKPFERCATCRMRKWNGEPFMEKYPRFINLTLRLVTFDGPQHHPGHIQCVIHSHVTVFHLGCLVRDVTGTNTSLVVIYAEPSPLSTSSSSAAAAAAEVRLPLVDEMTLEEYGCLGGPQNSPTPLTLYYDFAVDCVSCPLVMCDHYFGQRRTVDHAVLELRQRSKSRRQQIEQLSTQSVLVADVDSPS